ncbi:MAG: HAMP domain-containing protein [Anaerolineales bacterium]|jgi:HAMP domain-containing protein
MAAKTKRKEESIGETGSSTGVQISIRWKVLGGFTILFTIVYFLALALFTNIAVDFAENQIQDDLTQALEGAAEIVDVDMMIDLAEDAEYLGEDSEALKAFADSDERYTILMDQLDTIWMAEPDAMPYLYIPVNPEIGEIAYVVDLNERHNPDAAAYFLEHDISRSGSLIRGFDELYYRPVDHRIVESIKQFADRFEESTPWLYENLTTFGDWLSESGILPGRDFGAYGDRFGRWASGYMPLIDSSGAKVGGIGMDFTADYVNDVGTSARRNMQNAFLVVFPILLILVLFVSNFFTRPLIALTAAAEKVGEGDYETDFSKLISERYRDEIDTLAQVFSTMVDKVYQREQTLKQQVARLKIEIDEVKQKEGVQEIVETDFFQQLQSRANSLRSERKSKKPK